MEFRQWLLSENSSLEVEVVNMYFGSPKVPVEEILEKTGLSKKALYEIVNRFGKPNRLKTNHNLVLSLADQNMPIEQIAQITNYSNQNVKYILKTNEYSR
jgi:hypothetical protein